MPYLHNLENHDHPVVLQSTADKFILQLVPLINDIQNVLELVGARELLTHKVEELQSLLKGTHFDPPDSGRYTKKTLIQLNGTVSQIKKNTTEIRRILNRLDGTILRKVTQK